MSSDYIPTHYEPSHTNVCGINVGIIFSILLIYVGTMVYIISSVYFGLCGAY